MAQRTFKTLSDDELFADWASFVERTATELTETCYHRFLFARLRDMFDTNPDLHTSSGQLVLDWLGTLHARDAALFFRREYDTQEGSQNLLTILGEMEKRPQVLSRRRSRALMDTFNAPLSVKDQVAADHFAKHALIRGLAPMDDYLDPEGIAEERRALEAGTADVRLLANKAVAHRQAGGNEIPIRIPDDFEGPLAAVQRCFDKYYPVLTGKMMPHPTPIMPFDWTQAFRLPWATDAYFKKVEDDELNHQRTDARSVIEKIKGRTITTTSS